jgi:hypothetical protein
MGKKSVKVFVISIILATFIFFAFAFGLFFSQIKFYKPALLYTAQVETFVKEFPTISNAWKQELKLLNDYKTCLNSDDKTVLNLLQEKVEKTMPKLVKEVSQGLTFIPDKDLVKLSTNDTLLVKTLKILNTKESINGQLLYLTYKVLNCPNQFLKTETSPTNSTNR